MASNSNLARTFSYVANILLILYLAFLSTMADGDDEDLHQRLAMSIVINLRISQAAWWAIALTSVYGLFLPFQKRACVHLLGFLVNAATGIVHLYHMGLLFGKHDPLVPTDDPYHRIPLPFDWPVALISLAAFVVVASSGSAPTTTSRDKTA